MRTYSTYSALLIALMLGASACSGGTETVYRTGEPGATPFDPAVTEPEPVDPTTTGDPTNKDAPAPPLVNGLAITDIAVLQAVKVPVVTDGKAVSKSQRNAPVVVGRPGLIRVYVKPDSTYDGSAVTAELRLVDGTTRLPIIKETKSISGESTDADPDSTFNFEIEAGGLPAGVTYQVLLTSKNGTVPKGAHDGRFPTDGGVQSLDAETSGKLKLVIVPVKYDYDGSGRMPDVSATQLERYKQTFMAQYAAQEVEVTARAPFSYTSAIQGNGSGFSAILNAITNLRKADKVASDVYYYGALAPTSSFSTFCQGGCVTGLSTVVESSKSSFLRASVGVGFPGQDSVNTAAHEVGHAHGREHAPCGGAQNIDPDYPYSGGVIGVWGYNIFAKQLISPTKGKDLMGYCENEWVSDYTFTALFDRIAAVNGNTPTASTGGTTSGGSSFAATASASVAAFRTPQTFRMATIAGDGTATWGGEVELDAEPADGEARVATFQSATGATIGSTTARFYKYDHLPGGVLVVPPAPQASLMAAKARVVPTWSSVRISGLLNTLGR
jgi:hypothetical protein